MTILNLGCGTKTSPHPRVVNVDWSVMLRLRRSQFARQFIVPLLDAGRKSRLQALPPNVLVHDISKGLPFADGSVDAVYHSHVLEHLDRDTAVAFLREVRRVLRGGGIHRIVVPDFEVLCRRYLQNIDRLSSDSDSDVLEQHDMFVSEIIEQSVRRESYGTSRQPPLRRWVENLILGDARKRGETHQWMYDRFNLTHKLRVAGHSTVKICDHVTSEIPEWNEIGLDVDRDGGQYRPGSLYVEAIA